MFITLLIVTFIIALAVSAIVARVFAAPIQNILKRIITEDISVAWQKYMTFAIYVVGISSGVRIWALEKYITPEARPDGSTLVLNTDRWVLEVYRTIIETLQGIAWLLLIFFIFALIAYVIVKIFEVKKAGGGK